MSVLLVIACSSSFRRGDDAPYDVDHALYLKQQHHSLSTLQYSCDVVFVNNGGIVPEYLEYLDTLRETYRIIDRENRGMSLGALSAAWKTYPDYDYYILLEDDYLFVLNYFDEEMVEMIDAVPDCGYMCQVVAGNPSDGCPFPSFMNGIVTSALLERLGGFPRENEPSHHAMGDQMQKDFGTDIYSTRQFVLADMGSRFKAPFRERNEIKMYYPEAPYTIIVPSQLYEMELS